MISSIRRVEQAALAMVVVLGACEVASEPENPRADLVVDLPGATAPGTVTDLAVSAVTDTSVTLSFTEVSDGLGLPAKYDVRYSVPPISWGAAASVAKGTCASPVTGQAVGANRQCTVNGLKSSTSYQFQLVAFRGTLNVAAEFGDLSNVASGTTAGTLGTVTDLRVSAGTDTSVTLAFTEVSDGLGLPAKYDVRYAATPIAWGAAPSVANGTCATPVAGNTVGANRQCTINGLAPSTSYQFQLVSFRGTLNVDAVFGGLSNVVTDTTAGAPVLPPPPPPPVPPSSGEPLFNAANGDAPIYQDNMDQYTTPHDMDSWPGHSLHPFYPDRYTTNYAVIGSAHGAGKALRLVYDQGNGQRFIWKTNPENLSTWYGPANAAFVVQYWFRISKNGGPGGGPGYGATNKGMKWIEFWNLNGGARTQFSVTAGNATTGPLWHVNPASRGMVGFQPVGPYWNQVNDNQWHRVTYLYQPNSSAGATDGVARMWIDGTKIVDVSAAAAGVTPPGGTKEWCTLAEVAKLDVSQTGTINLGEYMNGGLGDGVTDLPMSLDFDDFLWWKLPARIP